MTEEDVTENNPPKSDSSTKAATKKERRKVLSLEARRAALMASLDAEKPRDILQKVARVLDQQPDSRNSDKLLVPAFWRMYEAERLTSTDSVKFSELFDLTAYPSIIRARRKIQHTFGLFLGEKAVRQYRKELEGENRQKYRPGAHRAPMTFVLCDESGKNGQNYIVGSVWLSGTQDDMVATERALNDWKKEQQATAEFHFNQAKGHNWLQFLAFFHKALSLSPSIAFKSTAIARSSTGGRHVDDSIFRLHLELLHRGFTHEAQSGRTSLPRSALVYKDSDDTSDKLFASELKRRLRAELDPAFKRLLNVVDVVPVDSKSLLLLQLADLWAGAINRKLNPVAADRGHKDELADGILEAVGMSNQLEPLLVSADKALHIAMDGVAPFQ